MMESQKRYKGPPGKIYGYLHECIVACPKCGKGALVQAAGNFPHSQAKLACYNCMFSEHTENLIRYRVSVSRNCVECGSRIYKEISNQKEPLAEMRVSCPGCGATTMMRPRHETYRLHYGSTSRATDPYFHLPLWLQTEVKGNLFWAYNKRHLAAIKSYIESTLRERQTKGYTTMVEKLPRFIIHAKNRKAILKAIDHLENR